MLSVAKRRAVIRQLAQLARLLEAYGEPDTLTNAWSALFRAWFPTFRATDRMWW